MCVNVAVERRVEHALTDCSVQQHPAADVLSSPVRVSAGVTAFSCSCNLSAAGCYDNGSEAVT